MKCYKHNDRDAVASCKECGRGLCAECSNKYVYPYCDNCRDLVKGQEIGELRNAQKMLRKLLFKSAATMVWTGAFLLLGILYALTTRAPNGDPDLFGGCLYWGVGGLPFFIFAGGFRDPIEERIASSIHYRVDATEALTNSFIGFFIKLILGVFFGAILNPILFILSVRNFFSARKHIKNAQATIYDLNAPVQDTSPATQAVYLTPPQQQTQHLPPPTQPNAYQSAPPLPAFSVPHPTPPPPPAPPAPPVPTPPPTTGVSLLPPRPSAGGPQNPPAKPNTPKPPSSGSGTAPGKVRWR